MSTTPKKQRVFCYARFSPRALQATCQCGHAWKVEATACARIFTSCPQCHASIILPNSESCEHQLADLRARCAKMGWKIAGEFSDKALSGGDDAKDRPGLFEAKVSCQKGDILLVWKLDRLFRDMERAAMFRAELRVKGVQISSFMEPEATDDTSLGKLLFAIYTWQAENFRETQRATTRIRMRMHQSNGRRMGRRPPFGWDIDPENSKLLRRNEDEQAVIQTIRTLKTDRKMGLRAIARHLEQQGVPRRGKPTWNHLLVRNILMREGLLPAQAAK